MSPDSDILKTALVALGIRVEPYDPQRYPNLYHDQPVLVARISSGGMDDLGPGPFLRASRDVCKISIWLGQQGILSPEQQLKVSTALLKLNYSVPLGRVSAILTGTAPKESMYIFAETMFFWRTVTASKELFEKEVRQRLVGLQELYHAAKAESKPNIPPAFWQPSWGVEGPSGVRR